MPVPELGTDKMSRPKRQEELPVELTFPGTDRSGMGQEAMVSSMIKEPMPRISVVIAVMTADKTSLGGVRKYRRLLIYNNRGFAADTADQPLLGWIVADTPKPVSGGRYMALLIYKEVLNMVVLDHELGRRMVEDAADRLDNTLDKGYGSVTGRTR